MATSASIKKRKALVHMAELDKHISSLIDQMELDRNIYDTPESVIQQIDPWLHVPLSSPTGRFTCAYRLWNSVPKEGNEDHWMYDLCTSQDGYIVRPMDEFYGHSGVHDAAIKYTGHIKEGLLLKVLRHDNFYVDLGVGSLIYTQVGGIDPSLLEEYARELLMVHPYSAGLSIHEAFKIFLEWQWAYYYAESTELMAVKSNEFLTGLGLDVRRDGVDPVVSAFMTLPDQQVAQYFKTGTASLNEETPECPLDVKMWLIEKNIMKLSEVDAKQLSDFCIRKIKAQRSYDALN